MALLDGFLEDDITTLPPLGPCEAIVFDWEKAQMVNNP